GSSRSPPSSSSGWRSSRRRAPRARSAASGPSGSGPSSPWCLPSSTWPCTYPPTAERRASLAQLPASFPVRADEEGLPKDALGPFELLFLLAPVAVVPLGLGLLVRASGAGRPWRLAGRLQPWAAAAVVLSFLIGHRGLAAGVLAVPWLALTLLVAAGGA